MVGLGSGCGGVCNCCIGSCMAHHCLAVGMVVVVVVVEMWAGGGVVVVGYFFIIVE